MRASTAGVLATKSERKMLSSTCLCSLYAWFYMWRKYDITVTLMTLMSCDSVCCMCGQAWSSRWLMMHLTNGQHAWLIVIVADTLKIPCDCQFVFSVLNELYVSHHAWCSGYYSKSVLLWPPCVADVDTMFALWFLLSIYLFSSPNLSRRRLDACHTSTHGVALVRI